MSKTLKISNHLSLPLDTVTQTVAVLAKRRVGKSFLLRRICEQLFKAGQQVVIVDPKGDQWGIRSSADGKGAGLPIVILGGERGDAPLEPTAGEVVAKLVVEEQVSILLDLSLLRKHELATFMSAFLETIYRLKAQEKYRTPMMLAIDEADAIAPQNVKNYGVKGGNVERMLGAAEDIVRRGGQRGIGCILVTQRSAVLNKNVLTQAQMLVALRIISPQDLEAMNAWLDVHGTAEQRKTLMESLPSLPVGDAWFWSPGWPTEEGIFQRDHVLPIETFDSGATPKPGEKPREPKKAADVDLDALKRQMAETVQRAKENDPKLLKQELVKLRGEVQRLSNVKPPAAPAPKVKTIERFVLKDGQLKRLDQFLNRTEKLVQAGNALFTGFSAAAGPIAEAIRKTVQPATPAPAPIATTPARVASNPGVHSGGNNSGNKIPRIAAPKRDAVDGEDVEGPIDAYQQALLDALAKFEAVGLTDVPTKHMAALAGKSTTSSTFDTKRADLKKRGLIDYGASTTSLTEAGRQIAAMPQRAMTPGDLAEAYKKSILTPYQVELFEAVRSAGDVGLTREELSERSGKSLTSSTFDTAVSDLRKSGAVVITKDKRIRPSDALLELEPVPEFATDGRG